MADYSSLATLPLVTGRVFYAPQVKSKSVFISFFVFFAGAVGQNLGRKP